MNNIKTTTVRMPADLRRWLETVSDRTGIPMNTIIVRALEAAKKKETHGKRSR